MNGIIFDIQKFSLYDGPGIRTVVFFKGCPLRCSWCSNPESQLEEPQLGFKARHCRHCGACVAACPAGAHQWLNGRHKVNFSACQTTGACVEECAYDALRMIGYEISVKGILREVEKDRDYFEKSGGGLTLSGGEPFVQFDFMLELLRTAQSRGLHTCVETSGYVEPEKLQAAAPFVDLFLYDFKLAVPERHRHHTGVDNALILQNLAVLATMDAPVVLRCPIIPGINDTPEHFGAITAVARQYDNITSVEIMAYHDMGRGKAAEIGEPYPLEQKSVDKKTAEAWVQNLHSMGCKTAKRG